MDNQRGRVCGGGRTGSEGTKNFVVVILTEMATYVKGFCFLSDSQQTDRKTEP